MVRNFPPWLGKLLRNVRPGVSKTLVQHPDFAKVPAGIHLHSPGFNADGAIAKIYTDDGSFMSPPLSVSGVPATSESLVIVVEDADSPTPSPFVHLIVWNLPATDGSFAAGAFKSRNNPGSDFKLGRNGLGKCEYTAPDPLPGHGQHRYLFQVFALDRRLDFVSAPKRSSLIAALRGHVMSKGVVTGTYERP
jgi:hypothetical protein